MNSPLCAICGHGAHLHRAAGPCAASDVTGPPCGKGRAVGDGYDHGSRTVTACDCQRFTPRLTVVES